MRAQHGRNAAGLTLVEVMIVVLVLGVVAGLAVPMLGETSGTKLAQAARLLEADLAYAQVESISHASDLRQVSFDFANERYHLAAASAPNTPLTSPIGGVPYRTTFGSGRAAALAGVTIESATPNPMRFGAYGQIASGGNGTIVLECEGRRVTLTVDAATGDVTIGNVW